MQKSIIVFVVLALLIGALIGGGLTYVFTPKVVPEERTHPMLPKEIPIGVELSITGDLAGYAPYYRAAAELAEEDMNEYLASLGVDTRVKLYFEDMKTTPEGALAAAQSFAAKGIKVYLNYLSSGLRATKSFVDENKIVTISYASTAPELAIPGDYIYRLIPPDVYQSKALARLIFDLGVSKVAAIYRGDDWGDGLYRATEARVKELGGQIIGIRYDPGAKELSSEVRRLSEAIAGFGTTEDVGMLAISFIEDFLSILMSAKDDPVCMGVKWFGTDGTVLATRIRDEFGEFIVKEGLLFPNVEYVAPELPIQKYFNERYLKKTGEAPSSYEYALYDAVWLATLTVLQVGVYDGEAINKALPTVAKSFYGLGGWSQLNEAGDRSYGDYGVHMIIEKDGKYDWELVGTWSGGPDAITWMVPKPA